MLSVSSLDPPGHKILPDIVHKHVVELQKPHLEVLCVLHDGDERLPILVEHLMLLLEVEDPSDLLFNGLSHLVAVELKQYLLLLRLVTLFLIAHRLLSLVI